MLLDLASMLQLLDFYRFSLRRSSWLFRAAVATGMLLVPFAGSGCSGSTLSGDEVTPSEGSTMQDEGFGPYQSAGLSRSGLNDIEVRRAMSHVPRHLFLPEGASEQAYADKALPIGSGQTISQPFIVALMTEQAGIQRGEKVLEIGTGSGYQAAVLAELGAEVFSVEIVPELAETARTTLDALGYSRIQTKQGDGWQGWAEHAPYDAILVTAASPKLPPQLLEQLADGGRLVIPIESESGKGEKLIVVEKKGADLITRNLGGVRFVPLVGKVREIDRELQEQPTGVAERLFQGEAPAAEPLSPLDSEEDQTPIKPRDPIPPSEETS